MSHYDEVDPYHPRYTRSEYLTYEQRERRRKKLGLVGALLALGCAVGLLYFFG